MKIVALILGHTNIEMQFALTILISHTFQHLEFLFRIDQRIIARMLAYRLPKTFAIEGR